MGVRSVFHTLGVRPWLVGSVLGPWLFVALQGEACSIRGLLGSPNQAPFGGHVVPCRGRATSPSSPSRRPRIRREYSRPLGRRGRIPQGLFLGSHSSWLMVKVSLRPACELLVSNPRHKGKIIEFNSKSNGSRHRPVRPLAQVQRLHVALASVGTLWWPLSRSSSGGPGPHFLPVRGLVAHC